MTFSAFARRIGWPVVAVGVACLFWASTASMQTAATPITVTLAPDVRERAGIETVAAARGRAGGGLRVPATVQANAYRQVVVVSTAAGRVVALPVELGQRVAKGDAVAQIHSPEVAAIERGYVSRRADVTVTQQQVVRLERLVAIGAASQQELEATRAQLTSAAADVESARAQLVLLGRSVAQISGLTGPEAINAQLTYQSPIDGTVTARAVNPGQAIEAGAPVVTIVDLSTVWVVGEVYERDLAAARVGKAVTMTSAAWPGQSLTGRIGYVDPQISPETRTARVRVELANPGGRALLGMLVEMRIETSTADAVLVPRQAIQTIGDVAVVYIADAAHPGTFTERSVRLGAANGDVVEILEGVSAGERVVTAGSFLVRSERGRVNAGPPRPVSTHPAATPGASPPASTVPVRVFDISVGENGFTPAEISIPAGVPMRLRFTRQVDKTCATEVVFASLKITKALPLGKPVIIDVPAQPAGRLSFSCGMNMFKGQVVVR